MVEAGQMSASVAAGLNPDECYGIWWFNRRRTRRTQVSALAANGERTYKKNGRYVERPKEEWVAVPVPDAGIPREWVDAARETLKGDAALAAARDHTQSFCLLDVRLDRLDTSEPLRRLTAELAKQQGQSGQSGQPGQPGQPGH